MAARSSRSCTVGLPSARRRLGFLGARRLWRGSTGIYCLLWSICLGTILNTSVLGVAFVGGSTDSAAQGFQSWGRPQWVRRQCCAGGAPSPSQAALTPAGKYLEEILVDAHDVADKQFASIWNSVAQKGRDGGVPGLRAWLTHLNLTEHIHAAMFWADRMGACALEEILENYDDFAADLGLSDREVEACEHAAQEVAHVAAAARQRHAMNVTEADESLLYLLLNVPDRHEPFEGFDCSFGETVKSLNGSRLGSSLEESFNKEVRERLKADLQYLRVMREYYALHLPLPPRLDGNKTWTFCGGSEAWLDAAGEAAVPVTLLPLARPVRQAMERVVLGKVRSSRLLRSYVASESGVMGLMSGKEGLVQLVNASKHLVLQAARVLAGAGGLPDWNRSLSDGLVPLGIVKEDGQNKTEIAMQVHRYFELMSNTRAAQADKYFGHVLYGFLLSALSQRFELVHSSGLLSLHPDVQRLRLSAQVTGRKRLSQEEERSRLNDEVFEQFVRTTLESETALSDLMDLSPTAVQAIRRHTDHIFGKGLREEIFAPLTRASRACARRGEQAAGPETCRDYLLEAACRSELRMLSLGLPASERLMWHGLVFGGLLQRHEVG